ncbi:hypothetical protein KC360_g103 [Hortaea werneckii]|nr:hypothetical protein KC360_g103 [Hortaea werneckii]
MDTANDGCNDRDKKGQAKDSNDEGALPLPPRAMGRLALIKDDGVSLLLVATLSSTDGSEFWKVLQACRLVDTPEALLRRGC